MSLEVPETNGPFDEKNPLDTSSSINVLSNSIFSRQVDDFYSPDVSVEMFALGRPVSSKSSNFSEVSQNSYNFQSLKLSQELQENQLKLQIPEKIPKKYQIVIESAEDSGNSKENLRLEIPGNKNRSSTIYTNLSSDSSQVLPVSAPSESFKTIDVFPSFESKNKRKADEILEILNLSKRDSSINDVSRNRSGINRPAASLRNSTFALTSRIFCVKCNADTLTNVSFQMKDLNFWKSIGFFFTAIKCCGEPRALSRYQDIVHSCKKCGTVVARISTV
jgi:hypothetical protein